jgi:sugar phosphate permease
MRKLLLGKNEALLEDRTDFSRWLTFLGLNLALIFVQLHRNSSGIIKSDLSAEFEMNATTFALFSSMYFYPYMTMQLPVGILSDKIGVRKTLSFCCVLMAVGTLIFASARSFGALCWGRAIIGVGVSAPMVCMNKSIPIWFGQKKAGTMFGFGNMVGIMGGILAQAPLAMVVAAFSWRLTFTALGIASFFVAFFCCVYVRNAPAETRSARTRQMETNTPKPDGKKSIFSVIKKIFTNRYTWPLVILMSVYMSAYILFSSTWGVPYIRDVFGYSNVEAAACMTWLMAGSCVSTFALPALSDRLRSRKKPLIGFGAFTFAIWLLVAYGESFITATRSLSVVMFLMGFTTSAMPVLFQLVREVNDPDYVGVSIGSTNTIGIGFASFMPVVAGILLDNSAAKGLTGEFLYRDAFTLIVVMTFIGLITTFFLKETHCQNLCSDEISTNRRK